VPRAYTITAAALALDVPAKWLDNTLSHFKIAGVAQKRQGVARRLSVDALLRLRIASVLVDELSITLARSINISEQIVSGEGHFVTTGGLQLSVDLQAFRQRLLERLELAVEMAPVPRRGRPPKTTTGRLD
jgi:hypothetical protein